LPYITAAALADGEITSNQFAEKRFTDGKLLELVAKVKVERNGELSRKYPVEVGNIVTIKVGDGRTLTKRVDVPTGNALRPLSDSQVMGKFHSMADEVIGADRAEALAEWVWDLDRVGGIEDLFLLSVVK
jgi:2-methylcitrate dehydratase